jgi:ferritin-like metal-binding protein YciE
MEAVVEESADVIERDEKVDVALRTEHYEIADYTCASPKFE